MDPETFLARVARATQTASLPEPPRIPERLPDLDHAETTALFRERLQTVDGVVHGPVSRHGAPKVVTGIAAGHTCETFMSWDDLPVSGIPSALIADGLERITHHVPDEERLEHQLRYLPVALGVTGAMAGLAESGTLVLSHGQGRPRMASLIPEVHVALLDVNAIDRSLAHWAHKHPEFIRETANLVLVTGPSRTADIEQTLNLGVHGPRHLHVVLVR